MANQTEISLGVANELLRVTISAPDIFDNLIILLISYMALNAFLICLGVSVAHLTGYEAFNPLGVAIEKYIMWRRRFMAADENQ